MNKLSFSSKPRVHLFGRHANRVVLAYEPYRSRSDKFFQLTEDPTTADYLFVGFALDLSENSDKVSSILNANPGIKIVVLSEEPLWDTVYTPSIQTRILDNLYCLRDHPQIQYSRIDHDTSDVFHYEFIPYFLTTSPSYIARYIPLLHSALQKLSSPDQIYEEWDAKRNIFAAVDKRVDDNPHLNDQEGHPICLSKFRVDTVNLLRSHQFDITVIGKGWADNIGSRQAKRQDLPDWHLEKLALLDSGYTFCFACENTHHPWYVSEKIFDSYASASIPIYYSSSEHSVNKVLKLSSYLNLYGSSFLPNDASTLLRDADFRDLHIRMTADIEKLISLFKFKDLFHSEVESRLYRILRILEQLFAIS